MLLTNLKLCKMVFLYRNIYTCSKLSNKHLNINKQVKVLTKLIGNRKSGSKKHWYPKTTESSFTSYNLNKSLSHGKMASRRVSVLNKLFMTHITDLMTTNEMADEIVGKGIEISKVKVSTDFQGINVYWIAKGDENDVIIEEILRKCSGILRHELSQLRLMGEVPKIYFVKDKTYSNLAEVQILLQQCGLDDDDDDNFDINDFNNAILNDMNLKPTNWIMKEDDEVNTMMKMRQDVLGLDHTKIMDKIRTKMSKSKKAWDNHGQDLVPNQIGEEFEIPKSTRDKLIHETVQNRKTFEKFLLQTKIKNNYSKKEKYADIQHALYQFNQNQCDINDNRESEESFDYEHDLKKNS